MLDFVVGLKRGGLRKTKKRTKSQETFSQQKNYYETVGISMKAQRNVTGARQYKTVQKNTTQQTGQATTGAGVVNASSTCPKAAETNDQ